MTELKIDPPRYRPRQLLLSGLDTLEVSYFLDVPSNDLDPEDLETRIRAWEVFQW